ncbi:glutathione peroxidase [Parachryseolinea silvisoli]|jgi:glutathione peroxidase|uniref:glutathione peroxidase n=1 Tax=Parachryseolinea silvisoli TaxID=2873601 RepID=UPI002265C535|nr:glutathione peroxidase [Parachryseolinea silvisoli]MCD9015395.1 glutathione peroxidase [Parachryseolinea silvisoli]
MRLIKVTAWIAVTMGLVAFFSSKLLSAKKREAVEGSIYDFKMRALDGEEIDLARYKGKYMLIVNTASKCGFTPQYGDLEKLHEQFGDKVAVLGFPANNFLWQEPGSNGDIATFCQKNYGVKFQMFEKISVKGRDQHALYRWLQDRSGHAPSWNFCKYLIDREGNVVSFYPSKVNPLDEQIVSKISI